MNSDRRGVASEFIVKTDIIENGYNVSTPEVKCKYDLVVEVEKELLKVQVKRGYKDKGRESTLRVNIYDQNKNSQPNDAYQRDDVDIFAIHDPVNDEIYWFRYEETPSSEMRKKYSDLVKDRIEYKLYDDRSIYDF